MIYKFKASKQVQEEDRKIEFSLYYATELKHSPILNISEINLETGVVSTESSVKSTMQVLIFMSIHFSC